MCLFLFFPVSVRSYLQYKHQCGSYDDEKYCNSYVSRVFGYVSDFLAGLDHAGRYALVKRQESLS